MSRSQINYVNDSTVGKRKVIGAVGYKNGKEMEKIKGLDFETVTRGVGTEDLIGRGNTAQCGFYISTVVSSATVVLLTATDENGTGMGAFETFTIGGGVGTEISSVDPNSGKVILTAAGVTALGTNYLFAKYDYLLAKGNMELERIITDNSTYVRQNGVTAQVRREVGTPNSDVDGNFRHDRLGLHVDGTASRTGDIYVVRDRIANRSFVAFGSNLDFADTTYWKEINPIAEVANEDRKYIQDAAVHDGNVVTMTAGVVSGPDVNNRYTVAIGGALTVSEFKASFPYTMCLVEPSLKVALPIYDNAAHAITFAAGFVAPAALNGKAVYVRKKKSGDYEKKNSAL